MRVGISTSVIQRGKTGVGQYLFALLRALLTRRTQHEFVLFVLEEDLPLFDFTSSSMRLVPVPEKFRPPLRNILWHQTALPKLTRELRLDVLHIPSYRRMLWRKPCPLVATIHDLAPFHVRKKYDWARMFYGRTVVPRLSGRQDKIIAISDNTKRDIIQFFGLSAKHVTVVHNGLEHDRFYPGSRSQAREAAAQLHGLLQPFFLYVARLEHPAKNHVRLIEAFNRFKAKTGSNWQLALAGSDWHGSESIHQAAKQSLFSSDIRLLGFVSDEELPDLYRAADAFVYPSLFEGFGMPPTEAMACGCPVICSSRGSLGEVVGNAAVIIDPEDIDSISRELAAVAGDAALRQRLQTAGLERAKQFNWDRTAANTLKIYEEAFSRTKPQPLTTEPVQLEGGGLKDQKATAMLR